MKLLTFIGGGALIIVAFSLFFFLPQYIYWKELPLQVLYSIIEKSTINNEVNTISLLLTIGLKFFTGLLLWGIIGFVLRPFLELAAEIFEWHTLRDLIESFN